LVKGERKKEEGGRRKKEGGGRRKEEEGGRRRKEEGGGETNLQDNLDLVLVQSLVLDQSVGQQV
jgi:hypothetical protein